MINYNICDLGAYLYSSVNYSRSSSDNCVAYELRISWISASSKSETLSLGTLRVQANTRLFISSCCLTNPQNFSGHSSHSEPWNPTLWIPLGETMRTLNAPCRDFRYSFQTSIYWHGPVPPHSITKLQPFPFLNIQPPSQDSTILRKG